MKNFQTTQLTRHVRLALFAGATALLASGAAFAATADADAQDQPATGVPNNTPAKTENEAMELGNVTVTAQSRTQQVQEVPIAMQVVTAQQIDALAATDLSKMDKYVPGLSVSGDQPTQPYFSIRGIGTGDFGIGTDAPVGVYENGIYQGKTGGALLMFNDIDHVEVLKGPQGTLFGRNSAAGAISVAANAPSDQFEANARLRLGNYGMRYGDGVLNTPLGDNVAFRMSFVDNQSDGWLRDAGTGQHFYRNDDWGTRMQLHWNAPAGTSVNLAWEHERLNQPPRPTINVTPLPAYPDLPSIEPDYASFMDPRHAPLYNDVTDAGESRTYDAFTLRVEHPLPFGDFTSLTSFQRYHTYNREAQAATDRDYLYFDDVNIERHKSWSQEFKLAGKTDLADWVAGASWYRDDGHQTSQINFNTDSIDTLFNNLGIAPGGLYGPLTYGLQSMGFQYSLLGDPWQESMINRNVATASAVYGDVIWHLSDRLNLTTGVRFTRDERDFSWYEPSRVAPQLDQTLAALDALGILGQGGIPPLALFQQNIYFTDASVHSGPAGLNRSWTDTSPRLVLDYKLTPDVMLYASAAKGYQAGGFNALEVGTVYKPQTVQNYEAGIKSYFADYKLLLNASVYYYKYSNLPNLTLVSNGGGNGDLPQYQILPSDQEAKGFEFEARWQATDNLRLNAAAAWIDQTYSNYVTSAGVNLDGQATGLPYLSATLGADYVVHDVAGGNLDFTLQGAYTGKTRCNSDSELQGTCILATPFKLGGSQARADFRVGWSAPAVPWSVALFVNNLFGTQYVGGLNQIVTNVLGVTSAGITAPRMWGVEANYRF